MTKKKATGERNQAPSRLEQSDPAGVKSDGESKSAPGKGSRQGARFWKLAPARRTAIINAASAEFAAHGLRSSSLNRIIEKAGLSKGALYYYFDSKEDLFLTVVQAANERLDSFMSELLSTRTSEEYWAVLAGIARRLVALSLEDKDAPDILRVNSALRRSVNQGELPASLSALGTMDEGIQKAAVSKGQKIGALRTDLQSGMLGTVFISFAEVGNNWIHKHFRSSTDPILSTTVNTFIRIFRRLVEPDCERSSRT